MTGRTDGGRVAVMLTQAEIGWCLSALASAMVDTKIHLARTPQPKHDPCCGAEARRLVFREEIHQAFVRQRDEIDSAMRALEAVEVRKDDDYVGSAER